MAPFRQWSRVAASMALLFASLPLASKALLGVWSFEGAGALACICAVLAAYFHLAGRMRSLAVRDPADTLGRAMRLVSGGKREQAIALLTDAIRRSPTLWQAYQLRGLLNLEQRDGADNALRDFTAAIALAPNEPQLYILRGQVYRLLGQEEFSRADVDAAAALSPSASAAERLE